MVAIARRIFGSLVALPPWLRFVYLVSLTWAAGHCYVTAYGSQAQREMAAGAGVFGAVCILVTLHVAIARYVEDEAERRAHRRAAAFISDLRAREGTQRPPVARPD